MSEQTGWQKAGSSQPQISNTISFREANTLLRNRFKSEWTTPNRGFRPDQDALRQLERKQQTVTLRLRTGRCGLRTHLKRIGEADTEICHCGNDQTPEHVLQAFPLFDNQRKDVWPIETNLETKLWGTADNLRLTIRFRRRATYLTTVSRTQKKKNVIRNTS